MKKNKETELDAFEDEAMLEEVQENEEDKLLEHEIIVCSRKEPNRGAWPSLILGIIGSLAWLQPIIGLPITVLGTVLGAMGMKKNKKYRGVSIAGFVVNVVFLTAAVAKGIVDIIFYCKRAKKH